jgi:trehalose 6-phosphate synthase/phosphatase
MGIDVAAFSGSDSPAAADAADHGSVRMLLGVDRLDYTKGIPQRLLAYGRLLRERPELRGRVRLVQIAVPSRERVGSYRALRRQVEELVGRINGEHGSAAWTPVHYVRRSISPAELVALYRRADVMLVTPLRDGMNLVAKEFVASRTDGDGVLVLSEFAGAAEQLRGTLTVNPHAIEHMAATMAAALDMAPDDRRRRMAALRARVAEQDVRWWSERFLGDLRRHALPTPEPARARPFWPLSRVRARLTGWARKTAIKTDAAATRYAS